MLIFLATFQVLKNHVSGGCCVRGCRRHFHHQGAFCQVLLNRRAYPQGLLPTMHYLYALPPPVAARSIHNCPCAASKRHFRLVVQAPGLISFHMISQSSPTLQMKNRWNSKPAVQDPLLGLPSEPPSQAAAEYLSSAVGFCGTKSELQFFVFCFFFKLCSAVLEIAAGCQSQQELIHLHEHFYENMNSQYGLMPIYEPANFWLLCVV